MAKRPSIYFAVKLVAPSLGKKRMTVTTPSIMETTVHLLDSPTSAEAIETPQSRHMQIGENKNHTFQGIAGHFNVHVLDFTEAEDKKCKSLAEAERLVKSKHGDWLANAYDWVVLPGYIHNKLAAPVKKRGVKVPTKK